MKTKTPIIMDDLDAARADLDRLRSERDRLAAVLRQCDRLAHVDCDGSLEYAQSIDELRRVIRSALAAVRAGGEAVADAVAAPKRLWTVGNQKFSTKSAACACAQLKSAGYPHNIVVRYDGFAIESYRAGVAL